MGKSDRPVRKGRPASTISTPSSGAPTASRDSTLTPNPSLWGRGIWGTPFDAYAAPGPLLAQICLPLAHSILTGLLLKQKKRKSYKLFKNFVSLLLATPAGVVVRVCM